MPAPTLTHTGQRLYDALAPFAYDDENQGWVLAYYCQALAAQIDEVADLTRDTDDGDPGYAGLFDLDTIAEDYLPYVGQFIGVQIPGNLTDDAKRLRIRETDGFKRGTPSAIKGAARQYLTGDKQVFLVERHGGAYRLTVTTYEDETPLHIYDDLPDDFATYDDVLGAYPTYDDLYAAATFIQRSIAPLVPAGIIFDHQVINPGTFDEVRDTHADFDQIASVYSNFAEIILNPTKLWDYDTLRAETTTYAALMTNYTNYADLRTAS